ncbi:hypothetical protein WISP_28216 [Willisornis vidua]|uniref:Uncharacterized protein n=1 Tax=Willisornis vidua TaxID=1566151 RepID=A0ABQ9DP06_9PASS|nr:hypothetical protein WISP_28216 [Willisornis vidua]
MVSTLDSDHKVVSREFESQWRPYRAVKCLLAIRSRQISDAQRSEHPRSDLGCSAGSDPVSTGCCDSPEDFTVTVQALSAVADGP